MLLLGSLSEDVLGSKPWSVINVLTTNHSISIYGKKLNIPLMLSKYKHLWSVASWLCLTAFGGLKARRGTEAGGDLLGHRLLGDEMCSCWLLLVLPACQNSPVKIGESETSRGTSTKMKCYIIRVNLWYFINTTVHSRLQIDPCSLIPWNILHCTIAFCSSFVFWLICHYKCDMFWLCIYI